MKGSRLRAIVSMVISGLFISLWRSYVRHSGEILMRQTWKIYALTSKAETKQRIGLGNGTHAMDSFDP